MLASPVAFAVLCFGLPSPINLTSQYDAPISQEMPVFVVAASTADFPGDEDLAKLGTDPDLNTKWEEIRKADSIIYVSKSILDKELLAKRANTLDAIAGGLNGNGQVDLTKVAPPVAEQARLLFANAFPRVQGSEGDIKTMGLSVAYKVQISDGRTSVTAPVNFLKGEMAPESIFGSGQPASETRGPSVLFVQFQRPRLSVMSFDKGVLDPADFKSFAKVLGIVADEISAAEAKVAAAKSALFNKLCGILDAPPTIDSKGAFDALPEPFRAGIRGYLDANGGKLAG